METNKIYVVGDIHGMFDKLIKLKRKLPTLNSEDKIIFLGDYIDRGPDGFKVLRYLYKWQMKNSNIICLKGNHEDMMINFLDTAGITDFREMEHAQIDYDPWLYNSAKSTIKSFKETKTPWLINPILQWVRALPLYHKEGNYNFSHSGYNALYVDRFGASLDANGYLWSRADFLQAYNGNERWFVGHTPTQEAKYYLPKKYSKYVNEQTNTPYTFNNITLMDTGSFITKELYSKKYGLGKISCLEITTNTLYQA